MICLLFRETVQQKKINECSFDKVYIFSLPAFKNSLILISENDHLFNKISIRKKVVLLLRGTGLLRFYLFAFLKLTKVFN